MSQETSLAISIFTDAIVVNVVPAIETFNPLTGAYILLVTTGVPGIATGAAKVECKSNLLALPLTLTVNIAFLSILKVIDSTTAFSIL